MREPKRSVDLLPEYRGMIAERGCLNGQDRTQICRTPSRWWEMETGGAAELTSKHQRQADKRNVACENVEHFGAVPRCTPDVLYFPR